MVSFTVRGALAVFKVSPPKLSETGLKVMVAVPTLSVTGAELLGEYVPSPA